MALVSVKELAKELGTSAKSVYAMAEKDVIPHIRVGCGRGTLRFDVDEVKASLKRKTKNIAVPLERTPSRHLS